jgi:UTP--glucose-1-phosphate uridylyltransferase
MTITKAIIPVAGWGTRMLPITKAIEKSMLPVGTRPVIDYVVQDVIRAGIRDIYFVVGEQSTQIQSYYRSNIQLKDYLERQHKEQLLPLIAPLEDVNIHFLTQPSTGAYGTSVPVGIAGEYIESGESAVVIMGDQFFWRTDGGSNTLDLVNLITQKQLPAGLFGNEIPKHDIPKYGVIEKDADENFVRIVEKPTIEQAPSSLNNASFYIFPKEIFELARMLPANPARGECEITDAINAYIVSGQKIAVGEVKGQYLECGSPEGWLHANNVICGRSVATDKH